MQDGQDKLTGLRDTRKPCHFWVDNEVADCYQPIVGADAIWVYCRIARNAHGAWIVSPKRRDGDTRVSLREMAEWCGKSVDTVWRCLQVLEHVGLLQAVHGAKSSGRYALADVKDLVTREGAEYDRVMGSFQLPPTRVAELKQQVKELRAKLARKASGLMVVQSVAQSDRLEGRLFSAPDGKCDSSVAPTDTSVAPDVQPSITQEGNKAKSTTAPQPPQAGACDREDRNEQLSSEKDRRQVRGTDAERTPETGQTWKALAAESSEGMACNGVQAEAREQAQAANDLHLHSNVAISKLGGTGIHESGDSCEEAVADPPFTTEQLAHLAKHANDAKWTEEWTGYYREYNRAAAREQAKAAEAERVEAERIARLKAELCSVPAARAYVMRECGFTKSRRGRGIEQVIDDVLNQELQLGKPLWETAPKMAAAWKSFQANGEFIDVHWGPVKFFKLGIWRDSRGWAWNEAKLERVRGARVGSV